MSHKHHNEIDSYCQHINSRVISYLFGYEISTRKVTLWKNYGQRTHPQTSPPKRFVAMGVAALPEVRDANAMNKICGLEAVFDGWLQAAFE